MFMCATQTLLTTRRYLVLAQAPPSFDDLKNIRPLILHAGRCALRTVHRHA